MTGLAPGPTSSPGPRRGWPGQARPRPSRLRMTERALNVDPIERLLVLDVLQPLEHRLHLGAVAVGGHQHELFLERGLIERALRGSLEARDLPGELAPVLEHDGDRCCRVLPALIGRPRRLDARRQIEDCGIADYGVIIEGAWIARIAIKRER